VDTGLGLGIAIALAFAVTNGLHDAANSIATLVSTRAAEPGPAIALASVGNVVGPVLFGTAVASTVAGVVTVGTNETVTVLGAALTGAVVWNLVTWRMGLPSSSGHALLGGLLGAALVQGGTDAVQWGGFDGLRPTGVIGIAVVLAVAPFLGLLAGYVVEHLLRRSAQRSTRRVRGPVRAAQWATSGGLALAHGANDAQKAVGVVATMLLAAGDSTTLHAPVWVEVSCGVALTLGTAFGGWPIVRTIGRRIIRLRPIDGLGSQSASALVLFGATALGAPVSTTQVVASSVVGVGGGRRRWRHVRWPVVRAMVLAWLITLPVCAALGALALIPWRWVT
jgi:PiT family inorganic phosphate transporter